MTSLKISTHQRSQARRLTTCAALIALAAGAHSACGPGNDGGSPVNRYGNQQGGAAGTGATGSGGTLGGAGGSSGSGISGIGGSGISLDSGVDDSRGDGNCGAVSVEVKKVTKEEQITEEIKERAPADVIIMFDQSQSMEAQEGGATRWQGVTQATIGFVQSPDSAGLGVGIQYFGRAFALEDCNPATYQTAEVPIGVLPGNAQAIVDSINRHRPSSETPTASALTGAITYARNWKNQNPTHPVFVLLVTDGEPGAPLSGIYSPTCIQYIQDMTTTVAAADAGFKGTPSIQTFVLGVGPSLANLNQIAVAGGTTQAYLISGGNVAQQVVTALNTIRGSISRTVTRTVTKTVSIPLDCEWVMPPPVGNKDQDPAKVNVQLTNGGNPTQLGVVPSAADCANFQNGWYYDDPVRPTKIIACPSTCDTIKAATDGKIDIFVGCDTYVAPPK
jgi:hypothetical protein